MAGMSVPPPRSAEERKEHVLELLATEADAWVATADARGEVCQIPLSFVWDGAVLVFSTTVTSVTGRNLTASGRVRIALGGTRDVVVIAGTVRTYPGAEVPGALADAFADKHVWDPRADSVGEYAYYVVSPVKIQSWREENELKGRTLMRDGAWCV
jgi:hypothetical protein